MGLENDAAVEAALRGLAARYAQAVDRRDAAALVSVFHADARMRIYDPGDAPEPRSDMVGHEALALITERIGRYQLTFHLVGTASYDLAQVAEGVATGEVYCEAHHLSDGTDHLMFIRYADCYTIGGDGGWRIADRRLLVDWAEERSITLRSVPQRPVSQRSHATERR